MRGFLFLNEAFYPVPLQASIRRLHSTLFWFQILSVLMKKFIVAVGAALGLSVASTPVSQAAQSSFEAILLVSKKTGDFMPVWESFVNTQFFVVIVRQDDGQKTKDFRFSVFNNPVDEKPYVLVSEYLERLDNAQSGEAIKVSGAKLVQLLRPELGIVIGGLKDGGAFAMPNDRVQWLRESIQSSK